MATKARPGTLGMANAWRSCEEATVKLGVLIAEGKALPLVQAAEARMLKVKRALS